MNEKFSKLRQEQKQEIHQKQEEQVSNAQQFDTVEEMLKADAAQIEVPRRVAEKLNRSIGQMGDSEKAWWKRLFKK